MSDLDWSYQDEPATVGALLGAWLVILTGCVIVWWGVLELVDFAVDVLTTWEAMP